MASAPELNNRVQFKIISNNNGNAYLHGGYFFNNTFVGDTYLFDTFSITWTLLSARWLRMTIPLYY